MSERGGRYERSFGGLIGAMVVAVIIVLVLVVARGLLSSDVDNTDRPAVDYLENVEQLQRSDIGVVYPASLPSGWSVTAVDVADIERPGALPAIGFDLLTDDDKYVGIKVEQESADDLLEEYVDEDPAEADPLTGAGGPGLTTDWAGWEDDGGDRAFTATYGEDRTVLVLGAVPADELADLVGRLTDATLPGVTPQAAPSP
ncbi:DUF4245 family protein [Nocardioides sp. 1609]|uniref:DUF4245 family protein n=1 Tax=Nocardioides sp. 1609 TaxID=2508327 RepID=UPI00106F32F3|nr:DUF4245 family protein [Nocardioides sp. 1609]